VTWFNLFFIVGFRACQNILLLFTTLCKERLCAPLLMEYPRACSVGKRRAAAGELPGGGA
jgi:hypothetical protein